MFKDTAKAAEWLQKAADQGDPNALFLLAGSYRSVWALPGVRAIITI